MIKVSFLIGVAFSCLSVIFGAFGAHYFKDKISAEYMLVYDKAVLYQMFHALAIIIISILSKVLGETNLDLSIWLFISGILFFSGSLYILVITDTKWLGAITPIGGTFFIIGWVVLFFKLLNMKF